MSNAEQDYYAEIVELRAELERVRHGGYSDWHTGYSVGR